MALGLPFRSRRGVIFTIMAIAVSSVLFMTMMSSPSRYEDSAGDTDLIRIRVVDGVVNSFISYAENALRSSVYNALDNMSAYLVYTDNVTAYFDDEEMFKRNLSLCVLQRGDKSKINIHSYEHILCTGGENIPPMLDNFSVLVLDALNVKVTYTMDNDSFVIYERLPFETVVNISLNLTVEDQVANWSINNLTIQTVVPLSGLVDPAFAKFNNKGFLDAKSPAIPERVFIRDPTKELDWNVNRLRDMVQSGTYRWAKGNAPSVLMRFYGDFGFSDCCGVETIINLTKLDLTSGGFDTEPFNVSALDHELFESVRDDGVYEHRLFKCNGDEGPYAYTISGSEWFPYDHMRLNASVLTRYNIGSDDWNITCDPDNYPG